jgi:hypothetical protein
VKKIIHCYDTVSKNKTFTVYSQKTKRYEGKDKRIVPIFSKLFDSLKECYESRYPNDDRVFTDVDFQKSGLARKFKEFVKQSGIKAWNKPLQRLRASRETELMEEYSVSVACKWIGNSPKIAMENYHKMRDIHFKNATQATPDFCPNSDSPIDETETLAVGVVQIVSNTGQDGQSISNNGQNGQYGIVHNNIVPTNNTTSNFETTCGFETTCDFETACGFKAVRDFETARDCEIARGSECGSRLDQITDQHASATTGKNEQNPPQTETNCRFMPIPAQCCPNMQDTQFGLTGRCFKPHRFSSSNSTGIEEIITIPMLLEYLAEAVNKSKVVGIFDEILLQSEVEFNFSTKDEEAEIPG